MKKNFVAIVGRPNVGKSSIFNYIADQKISIVDDTPGVTRDRIYANCNWLSHSFMLIDTGGIEIDTNDKILNLMKVQSELAIEMSDIVLMVVDGKAGLTDLDKDIANILRKSKKNVLLVVNKIDNYKKQENDIYEFYELGFEDIYPISAVNKQGIGNLLDKIIEILPDKKLENNENVKISIIGKPNVGKSSLVNKIIGENRVLVSDIAGTTRDAIDTEIIRDNTKYTIIDTAGLRKKSQINDKIELYSYFRTEIAIDRSDIVLVLIDASKGITKFDTNICGMAHDKGKGILIVINKWDLIEKNDKTINEFSKNIKNELSYMSYVDMIFISALTGQRVEKIFTYIKKISSNQNKKISTGVLNEILYEAIAINDTPQFKGKKLKIYYVTQSGTTPPTFVFFVNDQNLFHFSYQRYIENRIRQHIDFTGTPIKFIIRERNEKV